MDTQQDPELLDAGDGDDYEEGSDGLVGDKNGEEYEGSHGKGRRSPLSGRKGSMSANRAFGLDFNSDQHDKKDDSMSHRRPSTSCHFNPPATMEHQDDRSDIQNRKISATRTGDAAHRGSSSVAGMRNLYNSLEERKPSLSQSLPRPSTSHPLQQEQGGESTVHGERKSSSTGSSVSNIGGHRSRTSMGSVTGMRVSIGPRSRTSMGAIAEGGGPIPSPPPPLLFSARNFHSLFTTGRGRDGFEEGAVESLVHVPTVPVTAKGPIVVRAPVEGGGRGAAGERRGKPTSRRVLTRPYTARAMQRQCAFITEIMSTVDFEDHASLDTTHHRNYTRKIDSGFRKEAPTEIKAEDPGAAGGDAVESAQSRFINLDFATASIKGMTPATVMKRLQEAISDTHSTFHGGNSSVDSKAAEMDFCDRKMNIYEKGFEFWIQHVSRTCSIQGEIIRRVTTAHDSKVSQWIQSCRQEIEDIVTKTDRLRVEEEQLAGELTKLRKEGHLNNGRLAAQIKAMEGYLESREKEVEELTKTLAFESALEEAEIAAGDILHLHEVQDVNEELRLESEEIEAKIAQLERKDKENTLVTEVKREILRLKGLNLTGHNSGTRKAD